MDKVKVVRWVKILLLLTAGVYYGLVALNNLIDYDTNYQFVNHVLMMDTTFPGNNLLWRSINSEIANHLFYWTIIIWEIASCALIFYGTYMMIKMVNSASKKFNDSKTYAILGMGIGLLLWFGAFMTVGGEWFAMWMSSTWNGLSAAFRMFATMGIVFLFLVKDD